MKTAKDAYDRVLAARSKRKISVHKLIQGITEDFVELHGDRAYQDDPAVVGGIGTINQRPVTIVGIQKGFDTKSSLKRHFGSAEPSGYRKARRLMREAAKFNRPIVTLINTPGAYPGVDAEYHGQGYNIAQSIIQGLNLPVPYVSVIVGEGGSGGAIALAVGDTVWAFENSVYSILSPEGFATILWKDSSRAREAASVMGLTPQTLLKQHVIDRIVPEVKDRRTMKHFKRMLIDEIRDLSQMPKAELLRRRHARFRKFN